MLTDTDKRRLWKLTKRRKDNGKKVVKTQYLQEGATVHWRMIDHKGMVCDSGRFTAMEVVGQDWETLPQPSPTEAAEMDVE